MQTNKTLRAIVLGGIFILPFIFFWNPSDFFFPFITGKNFAFRIIVETIAALWAILALRSSEYRPKLGAVFYSYLAFIAILIAADFTGLDPARSFWSNSERMDGLITQLHLLLFFLVACAMLAKESLWEAFLKTSIVASILMSFYGLSQLLGLRQIDQSANRVDGPFGNATYLAVYLLFHIFLILYFLAKRWKEPAYRWLLIPAAAFECIILYNTATRGDVLGLGVGVLVSAAIVAIFEKENKIFRKISIGLIALVAIVVLGFLAVKNTDFVQKSPVLSRFASISATDGTTVARFMIWNMAFQGWKERPILGWGQENFDLVFSKYYNPLMYGQEPWFDRAHNVFFDWLVSGGVLGLLGYLSIFGAGLWMLFRNPRFSLAEKSVLAGLFAAYFFQNLFVFDNLSSYFMFVTLLAFVSFGSEAGKSASEKAPSHAKGKQKIAAPGILDSNVGLVQILTIVIACAAAGAVYFLNVPEIEANTSLIQALQTRSIADFRTALSYGSFADGEIREQLIQAAVSSIGDSAFTNDQKLEYVNFAISEIKKQVDEKPLDVRAKLMYGSLLNEVGLPGNAIPILEEAHKQSPNKQALTFELASAYLQKKEYPEAIAAAKQAYDLAPAYSEAAIVYTTVEIYAGKFSDAAAIIKAHPGIEMGDDRILQAYLQMKQDANVIAIWNARIAANPADPNLHVGFAGMLSDLGYRKQAVTEAEKAIVLENSAEKDAAKKDSFVKQVQALIAGFQK